MILETTMIEWAGYYWFVCIPIAVTAWERVRP